LKISMVQFLASQAGISAPLGGISGGGGGLSGLFWPDNPAGVAAEYKRGGIGLPSGQFQPQP
jgi:hypothetical protein